MRPLVCTRGSSAIGSSREGGRGVPETTSLAPALMSTADSPSPMSWIQKTWPSMVWAQKPSSAGTSTAVTLVGATGHPMALSGLSGVGGGHGTLLAGPGAGAGAGTGAAAATGAGRAVVAGPVV